MGSVLVVDSHAKQALVASRSLGSRGVSVTAGSTRELTASRFSRHVDRYITYPSPRENSERFVRAIESELGRSDYAMLLPVEDRTVETLVAHRERLETETNLPFPPLETLRIGLDKRLTIAAAREFDVPHPETLFSDGTSVRTVAETIGFPVVVKPVRGKGRRGVSVCNSHAELDRTARATRREHGPLLFQEFIPNGGERGVYTLYDRPGELAAFTVQRRLRSKPPEGGASTFRETVEDPELVSTADRLLSNIGWQGVAMAEFRIDPRSGVPQLMEINPRLWGSLALSVFAGVDFPYLLYRSAIGEAIGGPTPYSKHVQARCLFTDFVQVLQREDRAAALREFLTPATKPCRYDIVSREDPLPALGQLMYWSVRFFEDRVSGRGE